MQKAKLIDRILRRIERKYGVHVERDAIDFDSLIDSSLTYEENLVRVLDALKTLYPELNDAIMLDEQEEQLEKFHREYAKLLEEERERELKELRRKLRRANVKEIESKYEKLYKAIEILLNGEKKGLIITGNRGIGKTFNTISYLEKKRIKYVKVNGHVTPLQLYKLLYENREGVIVLDDVVNLFENDTIANILLGALNYDGVVKWITRSDILERELVPNEFVFKGKLIVIVNELYPSKEVHRALIDRCHVITLNFSRKEIIEMLYLLAKKLRVGKRYVDWLVENKLDLSLRDIVTLKDVVKTVKAEWKTYAELLILNELEQEKDEIDRIILDIFAKHSTESNNQKAKLFCELTGMSRATFYNRLKRLRRMGLIE